MGTKTTNTETTNTATVTRQLADAVDKAQARKHALTQQYMAQQKVRVQGSPFYRAYFGNVMPIIINGIGVYVPRDGKTYEIPKAFADVFKERIARVDALIQKQGTMADYIEEAYAGEVSLISEV